MEVKSGESLIYAFPNVPLGLSFRIWPDPTAEALVGTKTYTQAGHGLSVGQFVYRTGAGAWALAIATAESTLAQGIVTGATTDSVTIFFGGALDYSAHGLGSVGATMYLSASTAGAVAASAPAPGNWTQVLGSITTVNQIIVNIDSGVAS